MSQTHDSLLSNPSEPNSSEPNSSAVLPVERRKVPRHRTLKAGRIRFNRAGSIDCRVRNLSVAGAMLEVAGQLGIPEEFALVIESDHVRQNCRVIWRASTRLGVAFSG
jgi:hypothetical protein